MLCLFCEQEKVCLVHYPSYTEVLQSNSGLHFRLIRGSTPFSLAARLFMVQRFALAGTLGHLLHAFTGEHVGEPRLLICLLGGACHAESQNVTLKGITLVRPRVQMTFAKKWSSEFRL